MAFFRYNILDDIDISEIASVDSKADMFLFFFLTSSLVYYKADYDLLCLGLPLLLVYSLFLPEQQHMLFPIKISLFTISHDKEFSIFKVLGKC